MTGTEVINEQSREAMRNALKRIQSGEYAKMFIQEGALNLPIYDCSSSSKCCAWYRSNW
ncbi:hypothetical protein [Simiduia curdlanivorans]|uniref:hypothetical protein n=1 Tax=Simiduia curdlanivorans TaxID=1492769 RepID=UPI003F492120